MFDFPKNLKIQDCAILCGSGISIDSGVPTVKEFYQAWHKQLKGAYRSILDRASANEIEKILERAFISSLESKVENILRFEAIVEIFHSYANDKDFKCLNPLKEAQNPNHYHQWLVEAANDGAQILTTNFDRLIELAYLKPRSSNLPLKPLHTFVSDNDFQNWKGYSSECIEIFKLHGSFHSFSGQTFKDSIDSIQSTITRIGKTGFLSLPESKKNVFSRILKDKHLIVLGYSGGDTLDIIENMSQIKSDKMLIWINHTGKSCKLDACQILNFENIDEGQLSKLDAILNRIASKRKKGNVIKINCDSLDALKCLFHARKVNSVPELPLVTPQLPQNKPMTLAMCAALILGYLGHKIWALVIMKELYKRRSIKHPEEVEKIRKNSILTLFDEYSKRRDMNRVEALIKEFENEFSQSDEINEMRGQSAILADGPQTAIGIYDKLFHASNKVEKLELARIRTNQLTLLVHKYSHSREEKDFSEAQQLLKEAEKLWQSAGFLPRLSEVWTNGIILGIFSQKQRLKMKYIKKLDELNDKIGLYHDITDIRFVIGERLEGLEKYDEADRYYREVLSRLKDTYHFIMQFSCLQQIGNMWTKRSKLENDRRPSLEKAKPYIKEALRLIKKEPRLFRIHDALLRETMMSDPERKRILTELIPMEVKTRRGKITFSSKDLLKNIMQEATHVLGKNSNDEEALREKFACEVGLENFTEGLKTGQLLLNIKETSYDLNNYAICLANAAKYEEALEMLQRAQQSSQEALLLQPYQPYYNSALLNAILGSIDSGERDLITAMMLGCRNTFNPFVKSNDNSGVDLLSYRPSSERLTVNPHYDPQRYQTPRCQRCGSKKVSLLGMDAEQFWICRACGNRSSLQYP